MSRKYPTEIQILDSSWIESIQYDPDNLVLIANLRNGSRYRYENVGSRTFARVVTARSSGRAFDQHVKRMGYAFKVLRHRRIS